MDSSEWTLCDTCWPFYGQHCGQVFLIHILLEVFVGLELGIECSDLVFALTVLATCTVRYIRHIGYRSQHQNLFTVFSLLRLGKSNGKFLKTKWRWMDIWALFFFLNRWYLRQKWEVSLTKDYITYTANYDHLRIQKLNREGGWMGQGREVVIMSGCFCNCSIIKSRWICGWLPSPPIRLLRNDSPRHQKSTTSWSATYLTS